MREVERAARLEAFAAFLRRDKGRLFDPGPCVLPDSYQWDRADEMYHGKAVGVCPDIDQDSTLDIVVGEWRGFGPGFLGTSLQIRSFGHFGSTTHRSPLNIGYVHVLSAPFQRVVEADWRRIQDEEDTSTKHCECEYVYKGGETPCTCHWVCGGCCYKRTVREERRLALGYAA